MTDNMEETLEALKAAAEYSGPTADDVQEAPRLQIGFDVVELQVVSLKPGDILVAKLIGDYDVDTMNNLREHLKRVFTNNDVMVFTVPAGDDIQFQAIKKEEPKGYCNDCDCGKRESGESNGNCGNDSSNAG